VTRPRTHPRWPSAIAAVAWVVIGVVVVRMASGGGTIVGFQYVLTGAPPIMVVGGALLLAGAVALVYGFAVDAGWAWRASVGAGALAVAFGLAAGVVGHASAWILTAAAIVAIWVGWRQRA
jgi:hypothetical protein